MTNDQVLKRNPADGKGKKFVTFFYPKKFNKPETPMMCKIFVPYFFDKKKGGEVLFRTNSVSNLALGNSGLS